MRQVDLEYLPSILQYFNTPYILYYTILYYQVSRRYKSRSSIRQERMMNAVPIEVPHSMIPQGQRLYWRLSAHFSMDHSSHSEIMEGGMDSPAIFFLGLLPASRPICSTVLCSRLSPGCIWPCQKDCVIRFLGFGGQERCERRERDYETTVLILECRQKREASGASLCFQ